MRTLVAAATSMFLVACGGMELETDADGLKAASRKTSTPTVVAPTYSLQASDAKASPVAWKSSLPINSTYYVYLGTDIVGALSGHHTAVVYVYLPNGDPYQRFDIAFATDVAAGAGEVQAEKTSTGWRIWADLPVAGTNIQLFQLTGTWRSSVYLDSAASPNASSSFDLY